MRATCPSDKKLSYKLMRLRLSNSMEIIIVIAILTADVTFLV